MAGLQMIISQQRRRAEVLVPKYWTAKLGLEDNTTVKCHVQGFFQYASEDGAEPVAICELDDGRVIEVTPSNVKFVDTKEGYIRE